MKITLAAVLSEFDFKPVADEPVRSVRQSVTAGPADFRMYVRRRGVQTHERN
jgi:hypothetical protein